jgi:antitoxin CcdA
MLPELINAHSMRIEVSMATYDVAARKRAVNLTLNEDLVAQARAVTDNLSAVVESLLANYIAEEKQRRAAEAHAVRETVAVWNRFTERIGSFADDHATL